MAKATGQFIKYTGSSHRRLITADDWKAIGFGNDETIVWDWENGFSVPLGDLTAEQVEAAIKPDGDFVIMGGEDHAPRTGMQKMTGEQAMGLGAIGVNLNGVLKTDESQLTPNA